MFPRCLIIVLIQFDLYINFRIDVIDVNVTPIFASMKSQSLKNLGVSAIMVMAIHFAFASISLSGVIGSRFTLYNYSFKQPEIGEDIVELSSLRSRFLFLGSNNLEISTTDAIGKCPTAVNQYQIGNSTYLIPNKAYNNNLKEPASLPEQ